jgi:hypothetical protein
MAGHPFVPAIDVFLRECRGIGMWLPATGASVALTAKANFIGRI